MLEKSNEIIKDALYDVEMSVLTSKNLVIDILMFDYLTKEHCIPTLIKICKICEVSRYELIDFIKEKMVEILIESDIQSKMLENTLEKDIELIPIDLLSTHMNIEDKREVIFSVYKNESYSNLVEEINNLSVAMTNDNFFKTIAKTLNYRGATFDKCKDCK